MALAYSDEDALIGTKNRNFQPISGFGIDHCWTVACRQHFDGGV